MPARGIIGSQYLNRTRHNPRWGWTSHAFSQGSPQTGNLGLVCRTPLVFPAVEHAVLYSEADLAPPLSVS
jgi:hypothetical protein